MRRDGRRFRLASTWMLAVLLAALRPGGASRAQSTAQRNKVTLTQQSTKEQEDGEKKFQQNCSRCHNAPEGFTPRISGTIIRHMRVRASLSKQDAEAILRFLNP
jgi:cytochrome c2